MSILEDTRLTAVSTVGKTRLMSYFEGVEQAEEEAMRAEMDAEALYPPCGICGVYSPCDCDALRVAGAEEVNRLIEGEVVPR